MIEWGTPCSVCGNRSADGCGRDAETWAAMQATLDAKDTALAEAQTDVERLTGERDEARMHANSNAGLFGETALKLRAAEASIAMLEGARRRARPTDAICTV